MKNPYGVSEYLNDPEAQAMGMDILQNGTPAQKAQVQALAPVVEQHPEILETLGEGLAVPAKGPDFNPVTGRSTRDDMWEWLQKRRGENQGEFDQKNDVLNQKADKARLYDMLNGITSGLASGASTMAGFDQQAEGYRKQGASSPYSADVDGEKAKLYAWLQGKNKLASDDAEFGRKLNDDASDNDYKHWLMGKVAATKEVDAGGFKKSAQELAREKLEFEKSEAQWKHDHPKPSNAEAKEAAKKDKRDREDRKLAVPGWQLTGEVIPSQLEARDARGAVDINGQMTQGINQLMDMGKKYGMKAIPDAEKGAVLSLVRDLQLSSKGKALYELGVLTGPDMALLEDVLPNPTDPSFKGLSGSNMAALKQTLQNANRRLEHKLESMGYKRGTAKPNAAPATSEVVTLKLKEDGSTKKTTRAAAEAWLKNHEGAGEIVYGE